MKTNKKRLFEVMGKLDETFKPKLNENEYDDANAGYDYKNDMYPELPQTDRNTKYRAEVTGKGENKWSTNGLEYNTEQEAQKWLDSLSQRWFGYDRSRVVPTTTPKGQLVDNGQKLYQNLRETNEETSLNEDSTMSPMKKYVMFAYNFPHDFIEKVWVDDQNMVNHLKSKFSGFYDKYGSRAVMNAFFVELGGGNQKKLEDWIMTNYNG